MASPNENIQEYRKQLEQGTIQKAYREIMTFMNTLKTAMETRYPDYAFSSLYPGYMDMTYFAATSPALKAARLKIALVYCHESGVFEAWLAAANRRIQKEYIAALQDKPTAPYQLSAVGPGVDAILSAVILQAPNFDQPQALAAEITEQLARFTKDMERLLSL